jgi:hypothetical protein
MNIIPVLQNLMLMAKALCDNTNLHIEPYVFRFLFLPFPFSLLFFPFPPTFSASPTYAARPHVHRREAQRRRHRRSVPSQKTLCVRVGDYLQKVQLCFITFTPFPFIPSFCTLPLPLLGSVGCTAVFSHGQLLCSSVASLTRSGHYQHTTAPSSLSPSSEHRQSKNLLSLMLVYFSSHFTPL